MAANDPLKAELARLPLGGKLRLLFWLAEHAPGAVRQGLDDQEPKDNIAILAWRINGLDPEGTAAEPDPPAALG